MKLESIYEIKASIRPLVGYPALMQSCYLIEKFYISINYLNFIKLGYLIRIRNNLSILYKIKKSFDLESNTLI